MFWDWLIRWIKGANRPMQMSEAGVEMLKSLEGSEAKMYHDQVGLPTIGTGHLLTKDELSSGKIYANGEPVRWANGLTDAQIELLLKKNLTRIVQAVNDSVKVALTQPQFDALVSFTFNVGAEALQHSTLLKLLNAGDYLSVPTQMRRWIYSKGMTLSILVDRRESEIARWQSVA